MATSCKSTLLDLVQTVSEFATTEAEVLATITHLINSGKVHLGGALTGAQIDLARRTRLSYRSPSSSATRR